MINGPGKKKKKKSKSSPKTNISAAAKPLGSNIQTNTDGITPNDMAGSFLLDEIEIETSPVSVPIEEIVIEPSTPTSNKYMSRISIDRSGKRSLFSNGTGRLANKMKSDLPERKKPKPKVTVEKVLDDWQMYKNPTKDEIS